MTERKPLTLRDSSERTEAPALMKKGRGWEISDKRLDALHDRAREMRRHSSPAHKALAERFARADLGKYKLEPTTQCRPADKRVVRLHARASRLWAAV